MSAYYTGLFHRLTLVSVYGISFLVLCTVGDWIMSHFRWYRDSLNDGNEEVIIERTNIGE